ncbi:mitochondrial sodium/calcium exchanger protein-like [Anopheles marshallii]|uniref:mitochondrial sodium/calcium exchanger protein-like n=1 Tax=Anopheles marshallii TaxID=1521116 RepID=UPI00237AF85C|nr:mitochondrial sodium/calcium exchanger protein-like [Anopheles marshallii]
MTFHQNGSLLQRLVRHATYVNFPRPDDCSYLHTLPIEEQCEFVEMTEACAESQYYFNYVGYLYCTIGSDREYLFNLGFVLLLCICVYYFIILGTTADKFFCPTLAAIAKALNISEALAGVTILAFGNGSPDLFTAVANPDADTELMFSELLGSAAFVIGVIGGVVLLIQPFDFAPWSISRDLAFFIAAIVWITLKAADERFSLYDSAILIGMYILFLSLVIWEFIKERQEMHRAQSINSETHRRPLNPTNRQITTVNASGSVQQEANIPANEGLLVDFCNRLNPLDPDDWSNGGWVMRTFCLLKAPFVLLLLLTIPIVDTDVERDGWCKLLNICHCLTLPLLIVFVNGAAFLRLAMVYIVVWVVVLALPVMVAIYYTSRTDRCPRYHKLFTLLSFVGCIQVIYVVAQEVVSVLETVGIVLKLSKSVLGLSLLAWGNSVGDLFSNVALARLGYGKMAFAACFGGPLLNLCLGLGLTLMIKAFGVHDLIADVRKGVMGENCEVYLFQILTTTWLCLLFTNFQGRRSVGLAMIVTYLMFLTFSFLGEFELIHPYGTDHHPDRNEG